MVYAVAESVRGSDNSHHRSSHLDVRDDSTSQDSYYDASVDNLCLHWFSEGVRLGTQLQRDNDEERLSRFKSRMRTQIVQYEEEVLLRKRYCEEMEFLQSQLSVLRNELVAAQTAYEELAFRVAESNSGAPVSQSLWDTEDDFDALQQMELMEHEIDCKQPVADDDADQSRLPIDRKVSEFPYSNTESLHSGLSASSEPTKQDLSEITSAGDLIALQRVRTHLTSEAPEIFVDASTYGIGFIFNNRWLAWKFVKAHPLLPRGPDGKPIMSWAELVAVEMGIRTVIAASFRNVTVTVRSDNQGVVKALTSGVWKMKYGLNEIVQRILCLCRKAGLSLKMEWIWTKENPADDPSRGAYPSPELAFNCRPLIPPCLFELIQIV